MHSSRASDTVNPLLALGSRAKSCHDSKRVLLTQAARSPLEFRNGSEYPLNPATALKQNNLMRTFLLDSALNFSSVQFVLALSS